MARKCRVMGTGVQSGNNVSHANNRTRRRFLPNMQVATLMSDALGSSIRMRVTPRGLKTIDKHGGLDAFLLTTPNRKLSAEALEIKRRVQKKVQANAA